MDSQTPNSTEQHPLAPHHRQIATTDNGSCPNNNIADQSGSQLIKPHAHSTRGFGLKKWKRLPRDLVNPTTASAVDSTKPLKRNLPGNANPAKARHPGSVESQNVFSSEEIPLVMDSRTAMDSVFAAGTDSDNSEDRGSKSSTAASAPKPRFDQPALSREKNMVKAKAAKNLGNSSQRVVQQGKGKAESSKKARGGRLGIEKDNSQSSFESDSRSSNIFFTNGKQARSSASNDSEDANASEQRFDEEVEAGYDKENAGDCGDSQDGSASWQVKEAKSENNKFSTVRDPLVESILNLQSVQEALVKEVQKLGEMGNEPILTLDKLMKDGIMRTDSSGAGIHGPKPSSQLGSDKTTETAESSLQAKILSLQQNVEQLESKLDEARTLLVEKEYKVAELERSVKTNKSGEERSVELQGNDYVDVGIELEGIFKQRIEAEIEYLAITRATESWKVVAGKQVRVFKEVEKEAEGQVEMLAETENKAAKLKEKAQELENYGEEVLVSKRRVYKVTWCVCIQLMLLILVVGIFVSQLSPNPVAFVPT